MKCCSFLANYPVKMTQKTESSDFFTSPIGFKLSGTTHTQTLKEV